MKRLLGGLGGALALTATAMAVLTLTVGLASAASVNLSRSRATFTDKGLTLSANGKLTGLGNGDLVVEVIATGNPSATCTNPGGSTEPAGQNPAEVTTKGALAIPEGSIKNGTLTFTVETARPVTPIPGAPQCPNSNWREDITNIAFTSATINVYQPVVINADKTFSIPTGAVPVLTARCTFDPATADDIRIANCV